MTFTGASSGFINAQRYGAILVSARITSYINGKPDGEVIYGAVSTGSFTQDRNSNQRRTGQLTLEVVPTIPPPAYLPTQPNSIFAPFGNEVLVETGIAPAGDIAKIQWFPSGLFAIATSVVDDTSINLTVTLDLYDRSWGIAQRTFKTPWNFPATISGNFADEIKKLLNAVWAQDPSMAPLQYNIVPTSAVVPTASYDQGTDPWQAALDMAAAIGYELYFDRNGVVVGKPIPDPAQQTIAWNFTDQQTDIQGLAGTGSTALGGSPFSTPVECSVQMTRDGVYNDIIVQGIGYANMATYSGTGVVVTSPPALGEAFDNNPQSASNIKGGMGVVPSFISSSLVTTQGAQTYANNQLTANLSASWQITLTIPPMGILDIDAVVTITRPRVGLWRTKIVIDRLTQVIRYADIEQMTGRVLAQPYFLPT